MIDLDLDIIWRALSLYKYHVLYNSAEEFRSRDEEQEWTAICEQMDVITQTCGEQP